MKVAFKEVRNEVANLNTFYSRKIDRNENRATFQQRKNRIREVSKKSMKNTTKLG